jgi:hypothetical protein
MGNRVRNLENRTFLLLAVAISLAFAWILWPFYGAVLWATMDMPRVLRSMEEARDGVLRRINFPMDLFG